MFLCVPMLQTLLLHRCSLTRIWFVLIVCTCQAPKVFKDSDSTCDCLSENWQFALAELNSSHYIAVCVEDESRSSGLYFKIFSLKKNCLLSCSVSDLLLVHVADSGNGRLPLGLKVWKTVPFLEDTLVSGTEAVTLIGWVCESAIGLICDTNEFIFWRSMQGNSQHSSSID